MKPKRPWRTVKNVRGLPLMESVLVMLASPWGCGKDRVTIGWRIEHNRWYVLTPAGSDSRIRVTHWRPLPAAPKEVGSDGRKVGKKLGSK
jgi:hypothetical protein